MRKGKDIIGLKVLGQMDGVDVGTVKDLIFDHENSELLALLVSEKDLFGLIDAQVVPWDQVHSIGPSAVVVENSDSKINAGDEPRVKRVMNRSTSLAGTRIYTTDGQDLGTLADMYFDEKTGQILGYEVSGGFVSDTLTGKQFLPADADIALGRNVALVPPQAAAELQAQAEEAPGGLKGAASAASETVADVYGTAKDKVSETYDNIATASVEKQKEFVVGKTAARDVIIPAEQSIATTPGADISSSGEVVEGEVLVHKDEIITAEHAERAVAAGVLGQLVIAATGGAASGAASTVGAGVQERAAEAAIGKPAGRGVMAPDGSVIVVPGAIISEAAMQRARSYGVERELIAAAGVGAASHTTSEGVEAVKEGAAHLWDTIKQKASELTGSMHEKKEEYDAHAEQSRINAALGRPVTRVILDQSDNVILNTGEIITHAAVERARQSDALDILLDSVYMVEPDIAPEMMRVQESGQAALETQTQPPAESGAVTTPPATAPSTPS